MGKIDKPGHYTEAGTKKHQANGPAAWSAVFRRVAGRDGREGEGVRAALAYAVQHADAFERWAESHPQAWAPATTAAPTKAAKAAKVAKPKAVKPKPKAKAAKPKAAKAAKAKAGEQIEAKV